MRMQAPSEQNLEVYNAVTFDHLSHREVAEQFKLSTARVSEIMQQVAGWYRQQAPSWANDVFPKLQVIVAWRMYGERARHYMGKLVKAWRDSARPRTVTRESSKGLERGQTTVTMPAYGEGRYLVQAMRLAQEEVAAMMGMARLPSEWFREVRETYLTEGAQQAVTSPPVGVLAREAEVVEQPAAAAPEAAVENRFSTAIYDEPTNDEPDAEALVNAILNPGREVPKTRKQRHKELERRLRDRKQRAKLAEAG